MKIPQSTARRRLAQFSLGALTLLGLLAIASGPDGEWPWRSDRGWAVLVGLAAAVLFAILARGLLLALRALAERTGSRALAVAQVIVVEGLRRRLAVFAGAVAVVAVAAIFAIVDRSAPLLYQVQSFLTYSLAVASTSVFVLTLFLSASSVARDLEERHAYTVLTKPVRRPDYLFGKWLGIALIDLVLFTVAGVEIHAFTELQVRRHPDPEARQTVRSTLFRARRAVEPRPLKSFDVQVEEALPRVRVRDPERYAELGDAEIRASLRRDLQAYWRSIPAGEERSYRFDHLSARDGFHGGAHLRLSPRVHPPPPGDQLRLELRLDDRPAEVIYCSVDQVNIVPIPDDLLVDGTLVVQLRQPPPAEGEPEPSDVHLSSADSVEVLHPVGGFAGNLARGLLVYWLRVVFIAALGVLGSCFLSFPVACLLTLMVGGACHASAFLVGIGGAPGGHSHGSAAEGGAVAHVVDETFDSLEQAGLLVARALSRFGELSPADRLVDGLVVDAGMLTQALLWIGGLWTGSVILLAFFIFHRRELAQVQV